jgi:hypothetical protein
VQPAACDLRADGDGGGGGGDPMVTAYALRRPDGRLAVLLLNKDPRRPVTVRLARTTGGDERPVTGRLDLFQYSPLQWGWLAHPQGQSYADRDLPPYQSTVDDGRAVILPPYSVSVVRTAKPLP